VATAVWMIFVLLSTPHVCLHSEVPLFAFLSARSQAEVRALTRTKAPVVSTVPMIHFGQWQRL